MLIRKIILGYPMYFHAHKLPAVSWQRSTVRYFGIEKEGDAVFPIDCEYTKGIGVQEITRSMVSLNCN